jgi:hypothetical protein
MSKPKYRAYKPNYETDGVTTWVAHHFDSTVEMTPDDIAMMKSTLMDSAPDARVTAMQENLDSLQNPTSIIKLNADEIRSIHDELSSDGKNSPINREDLAALHRADELWDHIVILRDVMPKAITGDAVIAGSKKGGIMRGKQQSREKAEKDEVENIHGRGKVSDIINKLALMTDELGDYLSPRDELWTNLLGDLDGLGLSPIERFDDQRRPLRIDYRDGDGKTGEITFASFKSMVSTARGKVK